MKIRKLLISSLRTKLLVMFILLTVIPLIIVGMISYHKAVTIITENAQSKAILQSTQLIQEMDRIFQDVIRFTEIGKQESSIDFLMDQDYMIYENAKSILSSFAFYREIIPNSKHVLDISVISLSGKVISESAGVSQLDKPPLTINLSSTGIYSNRTSTLIQTTENSMPVISITRPIIWDITHEVIGYMTILLEPTIINRILQNSTQETASNYLIYTELDEELIIISNTALSHLSNTETKLVVNDLESTTLNENYFIVKNTSDITGWNFLSFVPHSEILKDANNISNLIIGTVASSVFFTITLYLFISFRLLRPIQNLKEKMKLASLGDLDVKVINQSHDEIADLGASFNLMIKKIKTLLQKSVNEEKQLKIAELRALQAQINPHFLYNTLDTIIWMAEAKKGSDVISLTKALSHFFRISLSKGKDEITIEQEIEHIKNYLVIQKTRYRDILEVQFDFNEEIFNYIILKITLQPLVENAIYHGIKNKRGKGILRIEGRFTKDGHILFKIIDNGIGIEENKLINIRDHLSNGFQLENNNGGFGMYNIQERIRLFYGDPFGIEIHSRYNSGTTVSLTIPAMR